MDKFSPKGAVSIPLFPGPFEQETLASTQELSHSRTKDLRLSELKIPKIAHENLGSLQKSPFATLQSHRINELTNMIRKYLFL